jgi:glutamyl-tRNA synthetase
VLHIGTARSALFNYLYAQQYGGTFLLRIEDTDKARSKKEFEQDILDGLSRLGLVADDVVRQSERLARHTECLEKLVQENKAYVSHEPSKNDPSQEVEVVRLRNPGKTITFHDEVRGDIVFDTTELGDMVIARAMNDPLYHLAVVIDDADMGVTHVIRGEDHISNTPRQILIQEALGFARPIYVHMPLILAPDRSKMSKRKGAVAIAEYLNAGYLPEALINFLALMGWNSGTNKEVYTMDELIEAFSLEGIQKSGAVFDIDKLKWLNREHRKLRAPEAVQADVVAALAENSELVAILTHSRRAYEDLLERYSTTKEIQEAVAAGEYAFYTERPLYTEVTLAWKKDPAPEAVPARLEKLRALLEEVTDFTYDNVKEAVWTYAEEEGKGFVLWPLRVALSGRERSPDPFLLLEALGKDESFARIDAAIAYASTH